MGSSVAEGTANGFVDHLPAIMKIHSEIRELQKAHHEIRREIFLLDKRVQGCEDKKMKRKTWWGGYVE